MNVYQIIKHLHALKILLSKMALWFVKKISNLFHHVSIDIFIDLVRAKTDQNYTNVYT